MMTTVDQGMSVEEIERVVAQRVANAIKAIAIYEMKTNMARKSMSQTKQQEYKVAENASNKRKCKLHHNRQCTVKCGNYKKVGHMTRDCRNPATVKNQRTHTCYECGSLRHFKSECPIVKFQKCVDKKISTLAERQAKNKRNLNNTSNNNQNQQQPNKRKNTSKAYTTGHGEKKNYGGSKPLCSKCNYHHDGPCAPKCPTTATELAIWPVTVGVLQIPMMLTTKGSLGKERIKPLRVRALAMTIGLDLPKQIPECSDQSTETRKHQEQKCRKILALQRSGMEKVGSVAYKLEFPQELSKVHNMFHVSNLKKCYSDKPFSIPLEGLHIDDKLRLSRNQ
ncbi:reverse transcriptase domain-containing protein [Tanacetum coccineum]